MITCSNCGRENDENDKICVYCGEILVKKETSTTVFDDTDYEEGTPKWGSARFNSRTNLLIGVEGEVRTFTYDAEQIEELVIGRIDPKTGESPEIDLTPHGGQGKGVSRRHALIVRREGSLYLVDNDSANGTYLNGQKLVAHQQRVLRDGDDIRLGHLVIRITFERA